MPSEEAIIADSSPLIGLAKIRKENDMIKTWAAFAVVAILCAVVVVWGNWKNRTMKAKTLFAGVRFIGLAALMLAASCSGNYLMILVAVAVALFFLVGANSGQTKSVDLVNKLMLAGAGIGFFISYSASHLAEAANHTGPGVVHYTGGYGKYGGLVGDAESNDDFEKVSENAYKDHEYRESGFMLVFGMVVWVFVADYAKKFTQFIPPIENSEN